ncbi:MAG: hypothetical protein AAGJ19_10960 [Myxococcota bacterium]
MGLWLVVGALTPEGQVLFLAWPNEQPGPVLIGADQTGFNRIHGGICYAVQDCVSIDSFDAREATLEHLPSGFVELVQALSQWPLEPAHEGAELRGIVSEDEVYMIGHLGRCDESYPGTGFQGFRKEEA